MARRNRRGKRNRSAQPQQVHPNAAGLDIGATEVYAAVRAERDEEPIRSFPTFTRDLYALADWLSACEVDTVAMESTGVYWIPVHQILEARGFEVVLVNARHVRSVPGRKSDVSDCEWLRYLHSVGLLRGSFRPADEVCAVRSLLRHRDGLIKTAARSVQHMQKACDQMNVHLHHAISDLTGHSGLAIIDAILAGEHDPARLAALAHPRIKASRDTLIKALEGDWRSEHLFTLRHARQTYAHYQRLISECDQEIEARIRAFEQTLPPPATSTDLQSPQAPETSPEAPEPTPQSFSLPAHLTRLFGTDLTLIPRHRVGHRTGTVQRTGLRSVAVPERVAVRILVEPLSTGQDYRGQGDQLADRAWRQPRGTGAAHVNPEPVPQPIGARRVLPPQARQRRHAASDYRHRPQDGTHHLPSGDPPRPLRRRAAVASTAPGPKAPRAPATQSGTRSRLRSGPGHCLTMLCF
ncbi:MAG: IS110 family transposase [Caldilineaceae bacterium]|nr:IS110 family transposase [Caldilineaceae bacterium]